VRKWLEAGALPLGDGPISESECSLSRALRERVGTRVLSLSELACPSRWNSGSVFVGEVQGLVDRAIGSSVYLHRHRGPVALPIFVVEHDGLVALEGVRLMTEHRLPAVADAIDLDLVGRFAGALRGEPQLACREIHLHREPQTLVAAVRADGEE